MHYQDSKDYKNHKNHKRRKDYQEFHSPELTTELTTIIDYVRWGVSQFECANLYFGHGTDNPWDEVMYLVFHALHLPLSHQQHFDKAILNAKLTMIERVLVTDLLLHRIKERKPAAYLTNTAYFAGLEFYVDERVLIPRSPIAELIEKCFAPWIETSEVKKILDLGTGCGCFAIASAYAFPEAQIDAIDISLDALKVAEINVAKHGLEERIKLLHSDLFTVFANKGEKSDKNKKNSASTQCRLPKYDVIIANPPYVSLTEMQCLPTEYTHEPQLALAAGIDGLDIIERLLVEAKNYLSENGILIAEVGNSAEALVAKYPQLPFIWLDFERGSSEIFLLPACELR